MKIDDTITYYQTRAKHKPNSVKTQRLLRRRDRYCRRFCRFFLFQKKYGKQYDYHTNCMLQAQLSWLFQHIRQLEQYLMIDNLGLVLDLTASRFNKDLNGCLSTDDIIQAGCLGLMTTIEKFDVTKRTTLLAYAISWIRQSATCEFYERYCTVHLPRWFLQQMQQIEKYYQDIDWLEPVVLQQKFKMTEQTANAACQWHKPDFISLSIPYRDSDKMIDMADVLADPNAVSPEKAVVQKGFTEDLTKFLSNNLSARDQRILFERYINHQTLCKVGEELHLTHERVRQLEKRSIQKIKQFIEKY